MAPSARKRKKENFSILEEIYHDPKTKNQPKKSIKDYFKDPEKVNRLLAAAILIFGLAAIGLGFFQFKYNIAKPFWPKSPSDVAQIDKEDLLGLRQKDTDQDGLSDYDELYLYGSSPYLSDSDSDGVSDQQEVILGTDLNCPEGQNCFALWGDGSGSTGSDPADLLLSGDLEASQLRQLLQQAGMSEAELANFSNEELVATFEAVLDQGQVGSEQPSQSVTLPVTQVEDLTPNQVRQLLAEAGVEKDILEQITDAELMDLVKETLSTY